MAPRSVTSIEQYLDGLDAERRELVEKVRRLINENIPAGYSEGIGFGMISWTVPLETYPDTYNKQPLMYAGLASQKNYVSLYLMCTYSSEPRRQHFEDAVRASGMRVNLGKSCVRFKRLEDLPIEAVAETIASTSVEAFIADYESAKGAGRRSS